MTRKLFERQFLDYYVNLSRFAYTFVKDKDIAEDIVQEMFISLWENRESLNINNSMRTYLYTSVKNRALNYLRNEKTRKGHENEFGAEHANKVSDIINFCERVEMQFLIEDAINSLPEKCQQIYKLSRDNNLTYNEIARQLDISPKTVENHLSLALKKIRNKLAPYITFFYLF